MALFPPENASIKINSGKFDDGGTCNNNAAFIQTVKFAVCKGGRVPPLSRPSKPYGTI
jgi:hypothetical protein